MLSTVCIEDKRNRQTKETDHVKSNHMFPLTFRSPAVDRACEGSRKLFCASGVGSLRGDFVPRDATALFSSN